MSGGEITSFPEDPIVRSRFIESGSGVAFKAFAAPISDRVCAGSVPEYSDHQSPVRSLQYSFELADRDGVKRIPCEIPEQRADDDKSRCPKDEEYILLAHTLFDY
jgi:hypothetical protein